MAHHAAQKGQRPRSWVFAADMLLMIWLLAMCGPASADEARPQRIVSINMCTDELVLRLANPDHIASVTWLSQDPRNANMAEEAAQHPANHALAEEVLAYHPDLVVAGTFTTRTTIALLKRTGVRVVEFGVPRSFDDVLKEVREMAALLGERDKGDAIVSAMEARLAKLAGERRSPPLRTIVLRPNGFTVGRGSLVDEIMTQAGLDNLAAHLGIDNYLQIPLEAVALQKAEVLILNGDGASAPSLATEALHHPIIAALADRLKLVAVPSRLWTCGGPSVVDAVELLIRETRDLPAEAPHS